MGIFERGGLFGGVAHFDLRNRDGALYSSCRLRTAQADARSRTADGRRRLTERDAMSHSATFGRQLPIRKNSQICYCRAPQWMAAKLRQAALFG
jgi:hypothetical protein